MLVPSYRNEGCTIFNIEAETRKTNITCPICSDYKLFETSQSDNLQCPECGEIDASEFLD